MRRLGGKGCVAHFRLDSRLGGDSLCDVCFYDNEVLKRKHFTRLCRYVEVALREEPRGKVA
jgi:hypothetical protein